MIDFNALYPTLRTYARKLTRHRENAEDLFQQTVLKMLEHQHTFDGKNPKAWSATIMRNLFYSDHRRDKFHGPMPQYYDNAAPSHDPVEFRQTMEALAALAPNHRDMLIARAEGYTVQEAAEMFCLHPNTVKSRTWRARDALLKALGEISPHNEDKE